MGSTDFSCIASSMHAAFLVSFASKVLASAYSRCFTEVKPTRRKRIQDTIRYIINNLLFFTKPSVSGFSGYRFRWVVSILCRNNASTKTGVCFSELQKDRLFWKRKEQCLFLFGDYQWCKYGGNSIGVCKSGASFNDLIWAVHFINR